jgi:hypothetical protein
MAAIEDVRALGAGLERSCEAYVRGRLKFRVGQIVYVAFSLDESVMGFAFPKEERAALVATEARELVVDAWPMVVPNKLSRAYDLTHPNGPG